MDAPKDYDLTVKIGPSEDEVSWPMLVIAIAVIVLVVCLTLPFITAIVLAIGWVFKGYWNFMFDLLGIL